MSTMFSFSGSHLAADGISTNGLMFGLILLVFVLSVLYFDAQNSELSNIPGPTLARYTRIWALFSALTCQTEAERLAWLQKLKARYGDVVRTGPRSVLVLDPMAVPVIYGLRSRLDKGDAYIPFRQPGVTTSLLSIRDEKVHSQYRKLVSGAYSMSSLKGYEPYIDEMIDRLVAACDTSARSQVPMNLGMWCTYYCYDVVSKVTLGVPLGFLNGVDVFGLCRQVEKFGVYSSVVSQMPWLHRIFKDNPLMRTTRPSPFLKVVRKTVQERLTSHDVSGKARPDLLSHFVATSHTQPKIMDERQVAITASGNLIAGALSPSKTLYCLCRFLVTQPEAQEKLWRELSDANCTHPARFDQLRLLPYLEGLVKEALRLHLSTSFDLQRVTGPDGLILPDSTALPAGVNVGCPAASINRDSRVFGDDSQLFKPERWMKGEDETEDAFQQRRTLMERTDLSFGQGSRSCIGKSIFLLEAYKMVATLVLLFKFERVRYGSSSEIWVKVIQRERESAGLNDELIRCPAKD